MVSLDVCSSTNAVCEVSRNATSTFGSSGGAATDDLAGCCLEVLASMGLTPDIEALAASMNTDNETIYLIYLSALSVCPDRR